MRDPITDAAQDSSCLLCLTPDRGGSWWSRLRPAMPRIFSTSAYWPGFVSAFNSNGIKNYRFSIGFSLSEMPSRDRVLFGNQMALGEGRFMLVLSSKGKIQVQDESSWSGTVEHPISGTGKHTVVIEIAESSGRIMIDGVEYAVSVARTAPILTIAFSNFPGTISSILLEADSGTLWQAAHSDLYAIYEPRNFADNPMAWTDAKTALDVTDQSHDFTFEIEFKCVETNAVYVFASDASRDFIRVSMSAGQVIVNSALMSTSPGGSTQFSAGSDSTNRHALTVKMIGNTITALIDGEIVYTRENLVRNAIEISAPRSNAGYVYKISITDDTTGEIVWQAAHSNLYNMLPPPPWPSPVPENFAEKAKAFYDCQAVVREELDPTHDYSFLIEAEIVRENPECSMFYAGGDKFPFGVYVYNDHTIRVFSNLLRSASDTSSKYVTVVAYSGDTRLQGRHTIESRVEGTAMRVFLDGNEIEHSYTFARTGTAAVGLPNCNSGYVYKIQITDLTDNQVVWSYPSEAERVRLITKTNVRTDRGAFEAADETQPARVDTALDLRGKVSSYTVVVDFEAAEFPETTTMECHQELAGQGGALIGSGTPPICSIGYYLASSGSARLQLSQEVAGGRHVVNATLTGRLSGRHICCGVVEVDPAAPLTASTLYLDGVRIGNASIYAVPTGNAAVNARCFSIAGHSFTGGWPPYTGKVYSGLLFDRALSAAEIAALTPKQA